MKEEDLKKPALIFTIFGITSNIFQRFIFKALLKIYSSNNFPSNLKIIAFTRRDWSKEELINYLIEILPESKNSGLLDCFEIVKGDFGNEKSFEVLSEKIKELESKWDVCANKFYYLAISPEHFLQVIHNMAKVNLHISCVGKEPNPKILIEKPFGLNLKEAEELTAKLDEIFNENQIFRIDHYLGKDIVRVGEKFNTTDFFQLNRNRIDRVELVSLTKEGINGRSEFFDKVGAYRDIGQNHSLQILAEAFSNVTNTKGGLHEKRLRILKSLSYVEGEFERHSEYHNEVSSDSKTETFFKVTLSSNLEGLKNAKIVVSGGKYQKESANTLRIFSGEEYIEYRRDNPLGVIQKKKDGSAILLNAIDLTDGYTNIFKEALLSDNKYFVSKEEMLEQWRISEPILEDIPNKLKLVE